MQLTSGNGHEHGFGRISIASHCASLRSPCFGAFGTSAGKWVKALRLGTIQVTARVRVVAMLEAHRRPSFQQSGPHRMYRQRRRIDDPRLRDNASHRGGAGSGIDRRDALCTHPWPARHRYIPAQWPLPAIPGLHGTGTSVHNGRSWPGHPWPARHRCIRAQWPLLARPSLACTTGAHRIDALRSSAHPIQGASATARPNIGCADAGGASVRFVPHHCPVCPLRPVCCLRRATYRKSGVRSAPDWRRA